MLAPAVVPVSAQEYAGVSAYMMEQRASPKDMNAGGRPHQAESPVSIHDPLDHNFANIHALPRPQTLVRSPNDWNHNMEKLSLSVGYSLRPSISDPRLNVAAHNESIRLMRLNQQRGRGVSAPYGTEDIVPYSETILRTDRTPIIDSAHLSNAAWVPSDDDSLTQLMEDERDRYSRRPSPLAQARWRIHDAN
jgi:hypothetical protein